MAESGYKYSNNRNNTSDRKDLERNGQFQTNNNNNNYNRDTYHNNNRNKERNLPQRSPLNSNQPIQHRNGNNCNGNDHPGNGCSNNTKQGYNLPRNDTSQNRERNLDPKSEMVNQRAQNRTGNFSRNTVSENNFQNRVCNLPQRPLNVPESSQYRNGNDYNHNQHDRKNNTKENYLQMNTETHRPNTNGYQNNQKTVSVSNAHSNQHRNESGKNEQSAQNRGNHGYHLRGQNDRRDPSMHRDLNTNRDRSMNRDPNANRNRSMNRDPNINRSRSMNRDPNMNRDRSINRDLNLNKNRSMKRDPNTNRDSSINRDCSHYRNDNDQNEHYRDNSNYNSNTYHQRSNDSSNHKRRNAPESSKNNEQRNDFRQGNKRPNEAGRHNNQDWTVPLPRNERIELALFGSKNRSAGINFNKYDDIPVNAKGTNVPPHIKTFEDVKLTEIIRSNIKLAGYEVPTPVQKYAIPLVIAKRDVMACVQTGSGKTAAFLIPILNRIYEQGPPRSTSETRSIGTKHKPVGLVLTLTRELATQIYDESKKFAYRARVRPCVAYDGASIADQFRDLDRGCHFLVATPDRLIELIDRGKIGLENCRYVVLDKADRMLEMGFEQQIQKIMQNEKMPKIEDRQTLMFSATFPSHIQRFAQEFLDNFIFLTVGSVGSISKNITQTVVWIDERDKNSRLLEIFDSGNKKPSAEFLTLVFVESKRRADDLQKFLYDKGFSVSSIHSDRPQREPEETLRQFRSGRNPILVATGVASRSIDIPNVKHVINYDLPSDIDEYLHRIGRAGNVGISTSFFTQKNNSLKDAMAKVLGEAKQDAPSFLRYRFAFMRNSLK